MAAQQPLVEYSDTDSEADVDAPAGPPMKKMKKKNAYTIEKKIEALDMLRAGRSQRFVSIHFRVDKNTDRKRQEDKLRKANN
ncbi:hypothetical protein AAVH_28338 [Aphelenchoides avenae]|nr:hypothetical protein AAVH_28338 [Aphelenchus avenae]